MWGWIVGKIISPFLPYILGGLIAAGLVGSIGAYFKGRSDMNAHWEAKELQRTIDNLNETIARFKKAAAEDKAQAEQELQAAQDNAKAIAERMQQAKDEQDITEAMLIATITDKEKLDAALKALRAKCRATPADVNLDKRLRGDKQRR